MNRLLSFALAAHGGLDRWNEFTDLVVDVEVQGELCEQRHWSGMVPRSRLLLSLREQRTLVLLPGASGSIFVRPDLISLRDRHGGLVAGLAHPRETMIRESSAEDWDLLRTVYFVSHAIRHSMTAPFLYGQPGFQVEEADPWTAAGEIWRGLKITFPADFSTPALSHFAYFGSDGLLRLTRNDSEMIGGLNLIEYAHSYQQTDGIWIATRKDVFLADHEARKSDNRRLGRFEYSNLFFTA